MSDHTIIVIWVMKIFLYSFFVYSCYLLLKSSASVRSIPFLFSTVLSFAWNIPLVSPIFLKKSLVSPILLFPSICIFHFGSLSYLSFLFFGTLHSDGYIFSFLLCLLLLFFIYMDLILGSLMSYNIVIYMHGSYSGLSNLHNECFLLLYQYYFIINTVALL